MTIRQRSQLLLGEGIQIPFAQRITLRATSDSNNVLREFEAPLKHGVQRMILVPARKHTFVNSKPFKHGVLSMIFVSAQGHACEEELQNNNCDVNPRKIQKGAIHQK